MPKDIEQRVRDRFDAATAERIIANFATYFTPDWSEASYEEIDGLLDEVAKLTDPAFTADLETQAANDRYQSQFNGDV